MFSFLEIPSLDTVTDWIGAFVTHQVILAPVILLLLEESGIPLPVPGDVYLAFVGYQVAQGRIPALFAFVMLMSSVLIGSSVLYFISYKWGNILVLKIGKYMHLNEKRLLTVEKNFKKYGFLVIIFGRHIPGFRVPITFFAGISGVPYKTFIVSTFISVVFWIAFYLFIGARLGRSVLKLFHSNPGYLILFVIPILLFFGSLFYMRYKSRRTSRQPLSK
jgi:membrane protein DedA with SNARE-associated domain